MGTKHPDPDPVDAAFNTDRPGPHLYGVPDESQPGTPGETDTDLEITEDEYDALRAQAPPFRPARTLDEIIRRIDVIHAQLVDGKFSDALVEVDRLRFYLNPDDTGPPRPAFHPAPAYGNPGWIDAIVADHLGRLLGKLKTARTVDDLDRVCGHWIRTTQADLVRELSAAVVPAPPGSSAPATVASTLDDLAAVIRRARADVAATRRAPTPDDRPIWPTVDDLTRDRSETPVEFDPEGDR